jgi:hypothetical protein
MMEAAVAAPRGIDLSEERPFRVGGAAIDVASREATFAGNAERLQPQNLARSRRCASSPSGLAGSRSRQSREWVTG